MFCCCVEEQHAEVVPVIEAYGVCAEQAKQEEPQQEESSKSSPPPETPSAEEQDAPGRILTVVLTRHSDETPWGLKLDFADERMIHVCEVRPACPASLYNANAEPRNSIRPGDYILAVNGVETGKNADHLSVADRFREELKSNRIELRVKRPYIFEATISKQGEPMGLELNFTQKGTSLVIMKVSNGAVKRSAPEVQPNDRIIAVQATTGAPEVLLQAITDGPETLILQFSRA